MEKLPESDQWAQKVVGRTPCAAAIKDGRNKREV
jgi:hypothetical protein